MTDVRKPNLLTPGNSHGILRSKIDNIILLNIKYTNIKVIV